MEPQNTPIVKWFWYRTSWRYHTPDFKIYYRATVTKIVGYWPKRTRQRAQKSNHTHIVIWSLARVPRIRNRERKVSSTVLGKLNIHVQKKWNWTLILHHIQKQLKMSSSVKWKNWNYSFMTLVLAMISWIWYQKHRQLK